MGQRTLYWIQAKLKIVRSQARHVSCSSRAQRLFAGSTLERVADWPSFGLKMTVSTTGRTSYDGTALSAGSPERFGYEWHHYPDLRPEYEEQFRRWTAHLRPDDWRGLSFLDVGCGMGRNSYWPMTYGAARGLAIDVDDRSLAAARRTLAPRLAEEPTLPCQAGNHTNKRVNLASPLWRLYLKVY
jgi:2-polyprenyl-3-methyl-5-hydroxy-6-metoxy-1,4-benzoquinol methylase